MLALVLLLTFVVLLMGILVAGLLRSHADILKALHDLGAGVGDPAAEASHGYTTTATRASMPTLVPSPFRSPWAPRSRRSATTVGRPPSPA